MQYRINKNWTPYAVITAVTVNVATTLKGRARQEAIENIGDPETRKASRHSPKKTAEACAAAVEAWLIEMLQAEVVPKKHLKMLRTTGGDLASWLYEFGKRRRRLPTTEVRKIWTVFTTTTALLQLKMAKKTRATRRIMAMLDPMTRALLLSLRRSKTKVECDSEQWQQGEQ